MIMERVKAKLRPKPENTPVTKFRRFNSCNLMPWEIRHQHTMDDFFSRAHGVQGVSKAKNMKRKTPNIFHGVANKCEVSHKNENLNDCLVSATELTNAESHHISPTRNVAKTRQQECLLSNVSNQTCNKVAKTHSSREKTQFSKSSSRAVSEISGKNLMKAVERTSPKELFPNVTGTLPQDTESNKGQLCSPYKLTDNKKNIQTDTGLNKSLKYAKKYNLDEIFHYAFPCGKEPLHKRLA